MEKGKEADRSAFCYVRWESDKRIFAVESGRHQLIRALGTAASGRGCSLVAFTILDDSLHALLHTDDMERTSARGGMERLMTDRQGYLPLLSGSGEGGVLRERAGEGWPDDRLNHETAAPAERSTQSLQLPARQMQGVLQGALQAGTQTCSSFRLNAHDSGWTIHTVQEAVRFCSDIHLLALRQGYVSEINDYWFSSWQTYRGRYPWEGLNTEPILRGLSPDPEEAMILFQMYQKKQVLSLTEE